MISGVTQACASSCLCEMYEDALTVVSWAIRDALVEILAGSSEDDARVVVVDAGDVERTQRIEGRSARGRERRRVGRRRGRGVCVLQANREARGHVFVSRLPRDTISFLDDDAVWAVTVRVLPSVHR